MSVKSNIFLKYHNKYFVESGCYTGDGLNYAVEANFDNIISIELSEKYYNICTSKFKNNDNVNIILGDSALILYDVIKDINERITFWLDGHYCFGDSACGVHICPLLDELEQIKRHQIKDHTLIIDDVRLWSKVEYGWVDKEDILLKIKEINPYYEISFEDGAVENDVLVARIKK